MAAVLFRTDSNVGLCALISGSFWRVSGYEFTLALRRSAGNEARSRLRCGCPHLLPLPVWGRSGDRKRRSHDGSATGRTLQLKLTTEGLDAVGEPAEP